MTETVAGIQVEDKGLKKNAITFLSNVVIGVASTAPGYSLAATLGGIAGFAAFGVPAVMIVAFIPMLFIAAAYYWMNRADPDCGTTFSWVTRAIGPRLGWIGGWAIIATDIIVMPNLAGIAGQYSFQLFGNHSPTTFEVTAVGVAWIVIMTTICYIGIELSARTQQFLLGAEMGILIKGGEALQRARRRQDLRRGVELQSRYALEGVKAHVAQRDLVIIDALGRGLAVRRAAFTAHLEQVGEVGRVP